MSRNHLIRCILLALLALLSACATRLAPGFGGHWHPVNRYSQQPEAIPLHASYVFAPSPLDGTLKAMLERWAADSNRNASYELSSDYTLPQSVTDIHNSDLAVVITQLNTIYAAQQVWISADATRITVSRAPQAAAAGGPGS